MKTLIYSIFILFTVNSHAQVDSTAESDEIIYHWNIAKYDRYIYYSNRTIGAGCAILGSGILTLLIGETSDDTDDEDFELIKTRDLTRFFGSALSIGGLIPLFIGISTKNHYTNKLNQLERSHKNQTFGTIISPNKIGFYYVFK